jgi:Protein of unknown function (DUF1573).
MNILRTSLLFWILFSVIIFYSSCESHTREKEIAKIVTEWQDKEIIFPDNLIFTKYGKDTIDYQIPVSPYKILMYVDSIGCTSCKLHLDKWNEFISEVDLSTDGLVPVLFFFHPKDKRELTYLLKRDGITVPVCVDEEDKLNSINKFPSHQDFQSFLLDKDNRVVLIGNPVHNNQIKEMYLSLISEKEYTVTHPSRNTIVQIEQTEFNLGTLKQGNATTVTALIRNIGEVPLVILDTRASCGCTHIEFDKKPVVPGTSTEIQIRYNAEDTGYFNKTVSIYGNTENSPIVLKLKGNVE